MKRIEELIAAHAPKGVHMRPLGTIVTIQSGWGFPNVDQGRRNGEFPFYKVSDMNSPFNRLTMNAANNYISADTARRLGIKPAPAGTVIFPKIGAAVATNKKRILSAPSAFDNNVMGLIPGPDIVSGFLFHWMQTFDLSRLANNSGAVPSIRKSEAERLRVPVPPLEVQREIVRILDQYTELEGELEAKLKAELEARRRQYNHYRSKLLLGGIDWRPARLDELFNLQAGKFIPASEISPDADEEHSVPCFGGGGLRGYVARANQTGERALIGRQGALCGNVKRASGGFYATEHSVVVTPRHGVDINWGFHLLTSMNLNQYASKSAQPGLAVGTLKQLMIRVPPLDEQLRIGSTLDAFDALTSELNAGLPAELTIRRKQYEHYRDRLLTFEEARA